MPDALVYLGAIAAVYVSIKVAHCVVGFLYRTFLASPLNVAKLGEWAVVTGATDGIGKAYAMQLAKRGLNIVLISRTPFKLQNVAAEIESKYKVKTKIIDIDFTANYGSYLAKVENELKSLEIGVLVNNVGMSFEYPEEFLAVEGGLETFQNLVNVNITSVNVLTHVVLPQMVKRGKGALINISSMSAEIPSPLLTVYAAAKAYVDKLTENLEMEYAPKGIVVQCVLPGYVVSNMSKIRKASLIAPMPDTFVKSALSRLGLASRTSGYFSHDLMALLVNTLPQSLVRKLTFQQLRAIRKSALKKKNKDQ